MNSGNQLVGAPIKRFSCQKPGGAARTWPFRASSGVLWTAGAIRTAVCKKITGTRCAHQMIVQSVPSERTAGAIPGQCPPVQHASRGAGQRSHSPSVCPLQPTPTCGIIRVRSVCSPLTSITAPPTPTCAAAEIGTAGPDRGDGQAGALLRWLMRLQEEVALPRLPALARTACKEEQVRGRPGDRPGPADTR